MPFMQGDITMRVTLRDGRRWDIVFPNVIWPHSDTMDVVEVDEAVIPTEDGTRIRKVISHHELHLNGAVLLPGPDGRAYRAKEVTA